MAVRIVRAIAASVVFVAGERVVIEVGQWLRADDRIVRDHPELFDLPPVVEQATAAPGEFRHVSRRK